MITIFMDGSAIKQDPEKHKYVLSWGMVANHDDQTTEKFGHFSEVHHSYSGFHEMVAFIEAMRYAKNKGFAFEEMSFYTDDLSLSYAGFILHPANFVATEDVDRFKQRLGRLCTKLYDDATLVDALVCLTKARFSHIKGHDRTVYNLRADYLARHGHQIALDRAEPFVPFESWITSGILKYAPTTQPYMWYPHFAYTPESDPENPTDQAQLLFG